MAPLQKRARGVVVFTELNNAKFVVISLISSSEVTSHQVQNSYQLANI